MKTGMMICVVVAICLQAVCLGALRADINQDGRVDLLDLAILAEEWLMSNNFCVEVTGSNITIPQTTAVEVGAGDFTMAAFIKPDTTVNGFGLYHWNFGPPGIEFYYAGGKLIFSAYGWPDAGGGIYGPSFEMPIPAGWTHVAVVANHTLGTCVLYVNGIAVASAAITADNLTPSTGSVISMGLGGGVYYYGLLDDFRIYKAALTAAEIANIYNASKGCKYNISQTPLAGAAALVFEFDEASGNTSLDTINSLEVTFNQYVTRLAGGVPLPSGNKNNSFGPWSFGCD